MQIIKLMFYYVLQDILNNSYAYIKSAQNCPANMSIIRELCDIRDGRHMNMSI